MKKTLKAILALVLVAVMLFSGCAAKSGTPAAETKTDAAQESAQQTEQQPAKEAESVGTVVSEETVEEGVSGISDEAITVSYNSEPPGLDAQNCSATGAMTFFAQYMIEGLVKWNSFTHEAEPNIAESWERLDEKTYQFNLRNDVFSHDGYNITSEDVIYMLENLCACSALGAYNGSIDLENCVAVDDYTVKIATKAPDPNLLKNMTMPCYGIYSKQGVEAAGGREAIARVETSATGPYKFISWTEGDNIKVERFEEYWGEKPYYKDVTLKSIPDDSARLLALQSGDIAAMSKVLPSQVATVEGDSNVEVLEFANELQMYVLIFNCRDEGPLSDSRVRQALSLAYNREAAVQVVLNGAGVPATGYFPEGILEYVAPEGEGDTYTYNLEKAQQLMKDAGYENGFEIRLICMENQAYKDNAEFAQACWQQLGVTVNLEVSDSPTFWSKLNSGDYDCYSIMNSGVKFNNFKTYNKTLDYAGGANAAFYESSDEFVEWLKKLDTLFPDDAEYMEYQTKVQQYIYERTPGIMCMNGKVLCGVRSGLTGYQLAMMGDPNYVYLCPVQ